MVAAVLPRLGYVPNVSQCCEVIAVQYVSTVGAIEALM